MEAASLEVVLLLDVSGSMNGHTKPLAEATWAIRQAADDIDASVERKSYCRKTRR